MRRSFAWRKFGRTVALILGVIGVSTLFSWGVNGLFTIKNVEVSGEGIQIVVNPAKLPRNILFFPVDGVRQQILKDYPLVGSVTVKKKYPSTLIITAVPRKPFAIAGVGTETYALDEDGVVLTKYPSQSGLPTIAIAMPALQPGEKISDTGAFAAINFLRETAPMLTVSDIIIYDNLSLRAQAGSMSIVFPQNADIPALARTLQTMIAGFRIKGKLPAIIDLRFDKPVVTF